MSENQSGKYHEDNKKRLQGKAHERYQSLFKEGKKAIWS